MSYLSDPCQYSEVSLSRSRSRSRSPFSFELPTVDDAQDQLTAESCRASLQEYHDVARADSAYPGFTGLRARKRPLKAIVVKVLFLWLTTSVIAGCIYAVLSVYSHKKVMSQAEKRIFNTVIVGLSITLGLSIAGSLDSMVGDLRWWILSRRYRSIHKVEAIIQADRTRHMLMLALRSRRPTIHTAVWTWVAIIVASQIGVASLGLCYSTEPADKEAILVPGNVSIPDMSSIQTAKLVLSQSSSFSAQQYTANSFGTISLAFNTDTIDKIPKAGQIWASDDPLMFCGDTFCSYIFHETSTESVLNDELSPVVVTTSRSLNVSTFCQSWPVVRGGDGTQVNITISTDSGRENVSIPIARGSDETIFMTNTTRNCGPGCSFITAFEASERAPWFYRCSVTVSNVTGATRPEHEVGAELTAMASGAIALQGYDASSLVRDSHFQYQVYPAESIFGTPSNGSVERMALTLSRFSAGVVAIAAESNNDTIIDGLAPVVGVRLNVSHNGIIITILILVAGLQLVLGVVMAWLANRVVIPREGALATAQVCQPMMEEYNSGNGHDGVHDEVPSASQRKRRWIYRSEEVSSDGFYDLFMEGEPRTGEKPST